MHHRWLPGLLLLALLAWLTGLTVGSVAISPARLWAAITGSTDDYTNSIIALRLPRVAAAFACGALLALAGVLLQALLRNPLADPYLIGVSGGASVAGLIALLLGLGSISSGVLAFVGALLTTAAVYSIGMNAGRFDRATVILSGVAVAGGCAALVALLMVWAPPEHLRGMLFWLMGDVGYASAPYATLVIAAILVVLSWTIAPRIDVLMLGDVKAASLGVAPQRLSAWLYIVSALAAAIAVAQCGTIGFVGLLVPHFLRLVGVNLHRALIPAAALGGGIFLVLTDTLARSVVAPVQLPIGAVTATLGVPMLLYLLLRASRFSRT